MKNRMGRVVLILAACFAWGISTVQAEEVTRIIMVSGVGKSTTTPDMATINTGVVSEARTAGEALILNNAAMEKVMATLKAFEIADKDVQTSNFNVSPVYSRDPQRRSAPEVTGYQVTNQVSVDVRKLDDLGKILDALVTSGSNRINGVSFGVQDSQKVLNDARLKAIQDGRARAELYAGAAGVKVGAVQTISEQPVQVPRPQMMGRMAFAAESASSVPVATGEMEFSVTINLVFELKD